MYGLGILFSELAHETQGSMLDRIWPVFLILVFLAAAGAVYFALRQDKTSTSKQKDEKNTHDSSGEERGP